MAQTSYPKSKIRVELFEKIHPVAVSLLRSERFQVSMGDAAANDRLLGQALQMAHGLGIRSRTRLTARRIEGAGRLLVVGCFCVGTNNVDLEAATRAGIPVFHAPHSSTRSVAELTIGLLLALSRRVAEMSWNTRRGRWTKTAEGSYELRGKILGIVGYGHIGAQVSVLAESLGMRVLFHDVLDRQPLGNARPVGSLDILLRESDFVTLHVPGGSGTYRLIGRKELRSVKPGSFLVNTSRGSVIDEKALDEALTRGRLGGVALDVLDIEPSSPHARLRNDLLRHACVLVTPHMGGNTVEAQERIARSVATKMVRFINQGATVGAVNFPQLDLPRTPGTHRVMHIHKNVPGVLSSVNGILSRLGANVESQYLKTNELVGYLVVDIDRNVSADVLKALMELPETLRARRLF